LTAFCSSSTSYSISQSTLNCLYYHHKDTDNFYVRI
jgi:hypothetical protein